MVRAEAPSELCQEPGTETLVLGSGEALGSQGLEPAGLANWGLAPALWLVQPVQDLPQGLP